MPNVYESAVSMLAATSLGAVWASQGSDLGVDVLLSRLAQIEPSVLFVSASYMYGGKRHVRLDTLNKVIAGEEKKNKKKARSTPF